MTTIDPTRALQRSINIAKLHVPTFEEVEADDSSTPEAAAVLVASAIVGSLGNFFLGGFWGFVAMVIATIGGWYVWAWVSAFIAERVFNVKTTDLGEMLRVIGYGSAPRAIGLLPLMGFIATIWTLISLVIGIRAAGEMTTAGAIVTAFGGLIPTLIAYGMILQIF